MDARPPAHERVVGDGERAQGRGTPAPDERPDPRPNRAELAVRRRPALGEDHEHPPVPEEPDQVAEVAGRPGGAAAPEVVEVARHSLPGRDGPPEEVGVGAVESVTGACRRRPPGRACTRAEDIGRLLGHEFVERIVGPRGEDLAEARHARAADRKDVDEREPAPDPDGIQQPASARGEVGREAGEESRQEHVVAGGEVEAVRAVAPAAHPEVERRAENWHVRLAPVRRHDQRSGLRREPPGAQRRDAKRGMGVRPHPVADSVVEVGHVYILALEISCVSMRVCGPNANRTPTGEQRRPIRRSLVASMGRLADLTVFEVLFLAHRPCSKCCVTTD